MLISSLVQYNVDARNVSSSARLRWEYTGGSELFVVYSDGRDTRGTGFPVAAQSHVRHQGHAPVQVLITWHAAPDGRRVIGRGG